MVVDLHFDFPERRLSFSTSEEVATGEVHAFTKFSSDTYLYNKVRNFDTVEGMAVVNVAQCLAVSYENT